MPSSTGAIHRAMATLECIARLSCNSTATLGDPIRTNPGLVPPPLNLVITKSWGYASEMGRHVREGREPRYEEAELIVGLATVISTYLARRL